MMIEIKWIKIVTEILGTYLKEWVMNSILLQEYHSNMAISTYPFFYSDEIIVPYFFLQILDDFVFVIPEADNSN